MAVFIRRAREGFDRVEVAIDAFADDLGGDDSLEHELVAKGLAREDVADVYLDRGPSAAFDRVAQRVAGMAQRAWIDDDAVVVQLLNPVDERALVVGLKVVERGAALAA